MTDLDQPVTRREFLEFRAELDARFTGLSATFATKEELAAGLQAVRDEMAAGFAEMRGYVEAAERRLRTHFDLVAENFRSEFRNLYDWTQATTIGLATRIQRLETDHSARLESLDGRVTRLKENLPSKPRRGGGRR